MFCINCFHEKTSVANSRKSQKAPIIWRRRVCLKCKVSFTTYEKPQGDALRVANTRTNQTVPFNIGTLTISIFQSFQHDLPKAKAASYDLAATVRDKLLTKHIVTTEELAQITHETLHNFDHLAGVQYAARHELIALRRGRGRPSFSYLNDHGHSSQQ